MTFSKIVHLITGSSTENVEHTNLLEDLIATNEDKVTNSLTVSRNLVLNKINLVPYQT